MTKTAVGIATTFVLVIIASMLSVHLVEITNGHTVYSTPVGQISFSENVAEVSAPEPVQEQAPQNNNEPQEPVYDTQLAEPSSGITVRHSSGGSSSRSNLNPNRNQLNPNRGSKSTPAVQQQLADEGEARVVVSFSDPAEKQAALDAAESLGAETHVEWSNGVAVTGDSDAINAIEQNSGVDVIDVDYPLHTMTYEGFDLIEVDQVLNDRLALNTTFPSVTSQTLTGAGTYSLTGNGQTVCLIDSGVHSTNPELQGQVIYSKDFTVPPEGSGDVWDHGTKMAGIIAAKGVNMQGLAYESKIVNMKIANGSGEGLTSYLYSALDWCLNDTNIQTYNITTVYIGLGTDLGVVNDILCGSSSTHAQVNSLVSKNISVVAAAGNEGDTNDISWPSCITNATSVGAVADGSDGSRPADDWNLTFTGVQSNRKDGLLDLLAPGDILTKTTNADPSENYTGGVGTNSVGTSVSAAYVTAASMLVREFWDERGWDVMPSGLVNGNIPNTIDYILAQSGDLIEDEKVSGVYYPRINLFKALNYEENLPVVTLVTANDSTVAPGTITLEYNVTDQHAIGNCKLYIDSVENQTDSSVTRDVTQSFSVDLAVGSYEWKVECEDTASTTNTGVSATNTINVAVDSTAPVISNVQNISITNVSITITWDTDESANSTVDYGLDTDLGTLVHDAAMVTSHSIVLTGLTPDTYYFYNVTSCDASGNCATSGPHGQVKTLANANDVPVLSGIPDNSTPEDVTPTWQIDLRAYTVDDQPLANGYYDVLTQSNSALINCYISGNQYLVCGAPAANQSGFSDILLRYEDEFSEHDNDTVRITVNPVNDAPEIAGLPNQNYLIDSGMHSDVFNAETYASDIDNLTSDLIYTITSETDTSVVDCSIDGSNNMDCDVQAGQTGSSDVTVQVSDGQYTDTDVFTVTVSNKNPSTCTLSFDKTSPQTYGTTIKASCTSTNPEEAPKMYRDGVDVTAAENGTDVTLAAGTYSYVCNVSETATYSASEDSDSFTINKASPNLVLDASPSWTEPEWTETTVSCTTSATGITVKLYFDGLDVSTPDIQTLNADTFDYVCNTTGNQNYSADEVSNTLNMTPVPDTTDPIVSLVSPTDTVTVISTSGNVSFQWIVTDNLDTLPHCKLWNNKSGVWAADPTEFYVVNGTTTTHEDTGWTDGSYIWNVFCEDNEANGAFAPANWTFDVSVPDLTPPVISNVLNSSITNESVAIDWDTDEPANSSVNYGTTLALGSIADNSGLVTTHGQNLYNLQPGTIYYYNVTSCDATGNCATDGPYSFITLANPNQPPSISGLPDQSFDQDTGVQQNIFNLESYASDSDNSTSDLIYTIFSETNTAVVDCSIDVSNNIDCDVQAGQTGSSIVTVQVDDGEFTDIDAFTVTINAVQQCETICNWGQCYTFCN